MDGMNDASKLKPKELTVTITGLSELILRKDALQSNALRLSNWAFLKAFVEAAKKERMENSLYFSTNVAVTSDNMMTPIRFLSHKIREYSLLTKNGIKKRGVAYVHVFNGWTADVKILITRNYTEDKVLNIINSAGASIGIGLHRKFGAGRFCVSDVKERV